MEALAQSGTAPDALQMIDSTVIRAHHPLPGRALRQQCPERKAAGAKEGLRDRVLAPQEVVTTKIRLRVKAAGLPMRTEITPGQTSDDLGFNLVTADNQPEPRVLLADRGYDADSIRKMMEARDLLTQIPMRKSRKMRVGTDHSLYSLRNLVDWFNKLKNARRVATRYDKTAESFLGFIDITSIRPWGRLLPTLT